MTLTADVRTLRRWARRTTRPCSSCGDDYSCEWVLDAWVCRRPTCGAEWYPDHDPLVFADPSELDDTLRLLDEAGKAK